MTVPLVDRVRSRLVSTQSEATPARVASVLRTEGIVLGDAAVLDLVEALQTELSGAGPLQTLIDDPEVTDVLVNGPTSVWVDRGCGLERTSLAFGSDAEVRRLAQRLAAGIGRRLDDANPYVDGRLGDGSRLHAVIPPIATVGTVISLRIPRRRAFTLEQLVECGSVHPVAASWLRAMVQARLAFVISGGTGTGKTTMLSMLLGLVPQHERIVIVEDSTELDPDHPHVVSLQARTANIEGAGAISMRDLVRQSLRMRPDRIVVGEVRGAEVVEMLSALNTGHEGGCGTVHANTADDVPARFEALGLTAGLDRDAVHALLAAGIDSVVHVCRDASGQRRVAGIHALCIDGVGRVRAQTALELSGGRAHPGAGADAILRRIAAADVAPPIAVGG